MWNAFLWGLLATSSLILGGLIATQFSLSKKVVGIVMAFGAGTLISAISYELIFEAVRMAALTGFPAMGLFAGALTFYGCDALIERFAGGKPTDLDASGQSRMVVPMVLAIILDGVPESIVIGLEILEGGAVSLAMLAAVFISNLPEAIAGSVSMKAGGGQRPQDPVAVVRHRLVMRFGFGCWLQPLRRHVPSVDGVRSGVCRRSHTHDARQFHDPGSL